MDRLSDALPPSRRNGYLWAATAPSDSSGSASAVAPSDEQRRFVCGGGWVNGDVASYFQLLALALPILTGAPADSLDHAHARAQYVCEIKYIPRRVWLVGYLSAMSGVQSSGPSRVSGSARTASGRRSTRQKARCVHYSPVRFLQGTHRS